MHPGDIPNPGAEVRIQSDREVPPHAQVVHHNLLADTLVFAVDDSIPQGVEVLQLLPKGGSTHLLPRDPLEDVLEAESTEHVLDVLGVGFPRV